MAVDSEVDSEAGMWTRVVARGRGIRDWRLEAQSEDVWETTGVSSTAYAVGNEKSDRILLGRSPQSKIELAG
jgi:hypothetical protein